MITITVKLYLTDVANYLTLIPFNYWRVANNGFVVFVDDDDNENDDTRNFSLSLERERGVLDILFSQVIFQPPSTAPLFSFQFQ